MEEFDNQDFTASAGGEDPSVQEFLAREQAAFQEMGESAPVELAQQGDDFQNFDSEFEGNPFPVTNQETEPNNNPYENDNNDFFDSQTSNDVSSSQQPDYTQFQQGEEQQVFDYGADSTEAQEYEALNNDPYAAITQAVETPEPILNWRLEQEERVRQKDEKSSQENAQTLAEAKEALENYYSEYNQKKENKSRKNREIEAAYQQKLQSPATGRVWERVVDHIDLNAKNSKGVKDTSRMRSLLLQLKSAPSAPGA